MYSIFDPKIAKNINFAVLEGYDIIVRTSTQNHLHIVKCAAEKNGIIISNDTFKDLVKEAERNNDLHTKSIIENNLLMFTFVGDSFMPPDDPLGRFGPRLDMFLTR